MDIEKLKSRLDNLAKHSQGKPSTVVKVDWYRMPSDTSSDDVKRLRKFLKMTQPMFAALLGVSLQTIKMWETDRRRPEATARKLMEFVLNYPELAPLLVHTRNENKELVGILKGVVEKLESEIVGVG